MSVFYADGKGVTVETMTLSGVPNPTRPGDPHGDGEYALVRDHGRIMEYIPYRAGWLWKLAQWCDLTELREVPRIDKHVRREAA